MTVNDPKAVNERGRIITYSVIDAVSGKALFSFEGKVFNRKRALRECQERKISGHIIIKWERYNSWGLNYQQERMKIAKKEK